MINLYKTLFSKSYNEDINFINLWHAVDQFRNRYGWARYCHWKDGWGVPSVNLNNGWVRCFDWDQRMGTPFNYQHAGWEIETKKIYRNCVTGELLCHATPLFCKLRSSAGRVREGYPLLPSETMTETINGRLRTVKMNGFALIHRLCERL